MNGEQSARDALREQARRLMNLMEQQEPEMVTIVEVVRTINELAFIVNREGTKDACD